MVKDLFEDHYAVHCHIDLSKPPFPREDRVYRKIKSIEASCFSSDILKSGLYHDPEISLDGLVRQYNSTLSDLLNNHAPLKRKKLITIRPAAPWMNEDIIAARKDMRSCERKYRQTRLTVHKEIVSYKRRQVKKMTRRARTTYYACKIETTKRFFKP